MIVVKRLIILVLLLFLVGCKSEHEHNYETKVVEATCLDAGYTRYSCSCGAKYRDNYTKALGHTYGYWELIEEATCNKSGKREKCCNLCGNVVTDPITKLECEFELHVVTKPTYYDEGLLAFVCEHGLTEDSKTLPAFSSGEYQSEVIHIPSNEESGLRSHKIRISGVTYNFYEEFESINDMRFEYEYDGIDVILKQRNSFSGGDLVIPEGVTIIGYNAFKGLDITSLTLPTSLKEIRGNAFAYSNIKSIYIPKNVVSIADTSFTGNDFESVTVDVNNSIYYSVDNSIIEKEYQKLILGTNNIPQGVRYIGRYAFAESNIEEIIIPEGVVGISGDAFRNCDNLKRIYIPSTIEYLGDTLTNYNVFSMCSNLEEIEVSSLNKTFKSVNNSIVEIKTNTLITASLNTVIEDISIIGYYAFMGLNITSIVIPDCVTDILDEAFASCSLLEEVKLSSNVKTIKQHVFYMCNKLDVINLDHVIQIQKYAFYGCKLTNLSLDNIIYIGKYAFAHSDINYLHLSKSLYNIDEDGFKSCNKIKEITIDTNNKNYEIYDNSLIDSETKEVIISVSGV